MTQQQFFVVNFVDGTQEQVQADFVRSNMYGLDGYLIFLKNNVFTVFYPHDLIKSVVPYLVDPDEDLDLMGVVPDIEEFDEVDLGDPFLDDDTPPHWLTGLSAHGGPQVDREFVEGTTLEVNDAEEGNEGDTDEGPSGPSEGF